MIHNKVNANNSISETVHALENLDETKLLEISTLIYETALKGNTIWTAGNGGSASTAAHLTCDIGKGVGMTHDIKFRCVCINELLITQSAWSNDFGFEFAIKNQLEQLSKEGDVFLAISGSGNSQNIVEAAKYSQQNNLKVISLLGSRGGTISEFTDVELRVDSTDMQVLENVHVAIVHWLYKALVSD
jgi:D-sedoheptulose 7-phosphate isomerase